MSRSGKGNSKEKLERQKLMLRLIEEKQIDRQEELQELLTEAGFPVTQATVSRDIRELGLVKASTGKGYRYVSGHTAGKDMRLQGRFDTIFSESVRSVDHAGHIVVVKCFSGMANAACEVFDSLQWNTVVGTLSGDDTFLAVTRTERDAKQIAEELSQHVRGD